MVGYDSHIGKDINNYYFIIAGGGAGLITRLFAQPLDVIKIRFQLQIEPINTRSYKSKYTGIRQAVKSIVREESLFGLWKGQIPAQILSIIYGIVQFTAFELSTKYLWTHSNGEHYQKLTNLLSGGIAGGIATVTVQPFDVIRTRLVAQGEPRLYSSTREAFVKILKHEGITGFYRGLLPSLYQIMPYTGIVFALNKSCQNVWISFGFYETITEPKTMTCLVCGAFSGTAAKTIVYPFDVIKKRIQIQGKFGSARKSFGETAAYTGVYDCFKKIIKHEGAMGLYKGIYPSMLKAGLSSALYFSIYEYILKILPKIKLN